MRTTRHSGRLLRTGLWLCLPLLLAGQAAAEQPPPPTPETGQARTGIAGGLAGEALPARFGTLPAPRTDNPLPLALGLSLGLLNTGGDGPTIPPPYIGGQ